MIDGFSPPGAWNFAVSRRLCLLCVFCVILYPDTSYSRIELQQYVRMCTSHMIQALALSNETSHAYGIAPDSSGRDVRVA